MPQLFYFICDSRGGSPCRSKSLWPILQGRVLAAVLRVRAVWSNWFRAQVMERQDGPAGKICRLFFRVEVGYSCGCSVRPSCATKEAECFFSSCSLEMRETRRGCTLTAPTPCWQRCPWQRWKFQVFPSTPLLQCTRLQKESGASSALWKKQK